MNNVYETANKLAKEIKESEEYTKYRDARKLVISNPELKSRIEEFEKIRYEVQVISMEKGTSDPEKMRKLQEMYNILVENRVMVADINKIIAESMTEIFNMK